MRQNLAGLGLDLLARVNLVQTFQTFWFASGAQRFLDTCEKKTLAEQLRERRITRVKIESLCMSNAGLGITDDGEFVVSINDTLLPAQQAEALGHEIGHTFHHNLTKTPPENTLPESACGEVELFCRAFAVQWVERNGLAKLIPYFENETELLTHCHVHV